MSEDAAALLATLPAWAFGFVLVLSRVGAAMIMLPGLGEAEAPTMVRLGLALGVTALLLPGIAPSIPPVPDATMQAGFMIGAEVITGVWLGWLARMFVLALPVAGQFIAYMMGVANVLQLDPALGGQATPIARLFSLTAPLIILVSGLYAVPLAALAGSYSLIPAGALLPAPDATQSAVHAVGQAFSLSVQLASPFLLAAIVWHVVAGLLARLVPRVQVYFVSMPGQILGGIALLAALGTALLGAWEASIRSSFDTLPGL